ncbi:DNA integrity scanning protein DisA nucleotide-binding domain protein [Thalassoroseus pseudoceratinae]|uniref:DNA integrity scanning protein DisA nucleotide-binding domain protein n=1 Tax=Thalassoroseus pseudoceratinae TaxID=2713176 RepID=UPI0014248A14
MNPVEISPQLRSLLIAARKLASEVDAEAVVMLASLPYDFAEVQSILKDVRLVVSSDKSDVMRAAKEHELDLVPLLHEPETRQVQLSQALLEAIADEFLQSGSRIVAVYTLFEREHIDTVSMINLAEHLAKLTTRDLRRLETQVPLETLRMCVDLAVEIGREGREGKPVGALMVVGDHLQVMKMSHEGVHDPFKGYTQKECMVRSPKVRESIKELAQIDGAFVITSKGVVAAAGRILDAPAEGLTLSAGLGARHWASAAISKSSDAIAIAVSESTGTVRIFQDGKVVLRIEPVDRGMKWTEFDTEPPKDD